MNTINNLQTALKKEGISALIVTNPTNIFYLTGFAGLAPQEREAILIVKALGTSTFITARLYAAEAQKLKVRNLAIKIATERDDYEKFIKTALSNPKKIAFEPHDLKFAEYRKFKKYAKGSKFVPTKNLIENLREIKSAAEIKYIETAQKQTQAVFNQLVKTIKIGQTELQIKDTLEKIAKRISRQPLAFSPIIASGPNSALPHHTTGTRKIKAGDSLLFDFGLRYKNYCADFSRTIFVGAAGDRQKNIFNLVLKSQQAAIKTIKPGIRAKKVFEAGRSVFKEARVDNHFIHSLGHGIGLEVHEKPSLGAKSKDTLTPGMVFSVEPGLYFPWGGVRIEDLVTFDKNRARALGKNAAFIEIKG